MALSVNAGELSAGVNQVAALFGDCEQVSTGVTDTLGSMISAAGHPSLSGALTSFTESSAHAMLNTGQVMTYIAAGLKQNATQYSATEATNTGNIQAAGGHAR